MLDRVGVARHRPDSCIIVSVGGRHALANKRDANGDLREFACRAVNVSPWLFTLATPVSGPVGERVITHFKNFGKLQGLIVRILSRGLVFKVNATDEERSRLAAKIEWMAKNRNLELPNERRHKRIIPKNPHATLIFSDGSTLGCFVIDMSSSGLAVSADAVPKSGAVLAVGKIVGRVIRRFNEGFAVQFVQVQDPRLLEKRLSETLEGARTPEIACARSRTAS